MDTSSLCKIQFWIFSKIGLSEDVEKFDSHIWQNMQFIAYYTH